VLPKRPDGCKLSFPIRVCKGKLDSSRTLKSVWTCCPDVWTDATLSLSESSKHWRASGRMIGQSGRKQGIRLLLSCQLRRIFLELLKLPSWCLWHWTCHNKTLSIFKEINSNKLAILNNTVTLFTTTILHASDFVNKMKSIKITKTKQN
jgi:hypothetical protein